MIAAASCAPWARPACSPVSSLPAGLRAGENRAGKYLSAGAARIAGGTPRDVTRDFQIRREGVAGAGRYASSAYTINHSIPGPTVELWQGKNALLRVHNHIPDEITSIHWHGILLPFQMDGKSRPGGRPPKGLEPLRARQHLYRP